MLKERTTTLTWDQTATDEYITNTQPTNTAFINTTSSESVTITGNHPGKLWQIIFLIRNEIIILVMKTY